MLVSTTAAPAVIAAPEFADKLLLVKVTLAAVWLVALVINKLLSLASVPVIEEPTKVEEAAKLVEVGAIVADKVKSFHTSWVRGMCMFVKLIVPLVETSTPEAP